MVGRTRGFGTGGLKMGAALTSCANGLPGASEGRSGCECGLAFGDDEGASGAPGDGGGIKTEL